MAKYSLYRVSLAMALTLLSAAPALALAANMDVRFGNTVQGVRPDGTEIRLYFNADRTFSGKALVHGMPFPFSFSGSWRMDGDKLCVLQTEGRGKNRDKDVCNTLQGDKVGDSWKIMVDDQHDKQVEQTMTIVTGR